MSGPPEDLALLEVQGQVLAVRQGGTSTPLGPLEGELLRLLARQAPEPVAREHLAESLDLSLAALYRMVYRLRRRLGSEAILQVGKATTRRGRALGFSGYRLALATHREPFVESSLIGPR